MPDPELLTFIAAIFGSLMGLLAACAWPASFVVLVLLLRQPILKAIPNLTHLKAAGFEFEFVERVQELERRADDAAIPPVDQAPREIVEPEIARLYALAEVNARSAILEAWLLVESSISQAAVHLGMDVPSVPSRSLYTLLKQLRIASPYSQELFSIVNELRHLRNKAVHELDFSLGLEETLEYINLSIRVSNALRRPPGEG